MNAIEIRLGTEVLLVEDVGSEVTRRSEVLEELKKIYGAFEAADWRKMVEHEPRLVELANELARLDDIISQYTVGRERQVNILDIWRQVEAVSRDCADGKDES